MDCPIHKRSAVAGELPEDSLAEILTLVPIKSLCRSKCVAKTWRDLIEDPIYHKKLPQTLQGFFLIQQELFGVCIDYVSLLARPAPLQIDTSLSFLMELPGYETLAFSDSCNGLLIFEFDQIEKSSPFDYVVWNPATKQWGLVPRYGPPPYSKYDIDRCAYLIFDPAISSHFHLVQFLWGCKELEEGFGVDEDGEGYVNDGNDDVDGSFFSQVHVYSSKTGQWVRVASVSNVQNLEGWNDQGLLPYQRSWCTLLNGMLHFLIMGQDQIVTVDAQGVTQKSIPVPMMATENKRWLERDYVAQSQGCLHYMKQGVDGQLSIWVLKNCDTQEWALKHSVSFMELFGKMSKQYRAGHENGYSVVGMHPDGNVVFIVQNWDLKLISYDMNHKLLSVIRTLQNRTSNMDVVPYVPCFLELPGLTNKY